MYFQPKSFINNYMSEKLINSLYIYRISIHEEVYIKFFFSNKKSHLFQFKPLYLNNVDMFVQTWHTLTEISG